MPEQDQTAQADGGKDQHRSSEQQHKNKQHVLTRGVPSRARSIAQAIVMKDENLFFLTNPDGRVPLTEGHGLGLYYHDCRFLNGYELQLANLRPNVLVSTAARGFMGTFELTNAADIKMPDGSVISKQDLGITWERMLDHIQLALHDRITFQNFGLQQIEFPLSLSFRAAFEDVFAVRGFLPEHPGKLHPAAWKDGVLTFLYDGADASTVAWRSTSRQRPQRRTIPGRTFTSRYNPKQASSSWFRSRWPNLRIAAKYSRACTSNLTLNGWKPSQSALLKSASAVVLRSTAIVSCWKGL